MTTHKDIRKTPRVKAWAYLNREGGNLGVIYRGERDRDGHTRKIYDICMSRAEARMRGCDKTIWEIIPVLITPIRPKRGGSK